jgi:hypothetical protein
VAHRAQPLPVADGGEAPEPPARHVLEEDALDRVLGAEGEDLAELRALDQTRHRR